jgi:hypothetical protein
MRYIVPLLRGGFCAQRLKGECKDLPDGRSVKAQFIVRMHILIWDTQVVLDDRGIVLGEVKKNKGLPCANVAVANSTINHT